MKLSNTDLEQLKELNISEDIVISQIRHFINGFPYVKLKKAATPGDGITQLDETQLAQFEEYYEQKCKTKQVLKFVPASGAASRMFKALFNFYEKKDPTDDMVDLVKAYDKFAFAKDLKDMGANGTDSLEAQVQIADFILNEKGLNYGHLPKGLIKFHQYGDESRTAFEEHLVEAAAYTKDAFQNARLHFTVSPEHMDAVKALMEEKVPEYEGLYGCKFDITYSTQSKSTDTIAVDLENQPFRNGDGSLLFRPAGHGALLQNLNRLDADVVFIKNIDNVVTDRFKSTTYVYKKALGGYLLSLQEKVYAYLEKLEAGISDEDLQELHDFAQQELGIEPPSEEHWRTYYKSKLNRPMRVCGMVKNEGEPGGGPFWVEEADHGMSLQIVETSQIDMDDAAQADIVKHATHFNPVDLVCATKNHNGESFELREYMNPDTGFISYKSKDGKDLKAQELPGLWNGAMANWITLFVEVPVITFNPVKTIKDLLRETHQPS